MALPPRLLAALLLLLAACAPPPPAPDGDAAVPVGADGIEGDT